MTPLPVDAALPALLDALRARGSAVLEAPPGAGKTTRVPGAILDAGLAGDREVVVLEPRRLAARLAARRVAEERGEKPGDTVGWQVRFEDVSSARTRIRFVTEGVLTRKLLADPTLPRVGAVVLDEFHERHLQGDVALAMLRALQRGSRPDLKLVVMSATLDGAPVARFLGGDRDPAPTVRSEGRRFDVAIEHLPRMDDRPLSALVSTALGSLVARGLDGDVLVFLPGAAEIRRAMETCADLARRHDLLVLPLHGDLPPAEQDRAVNPAPKRKVILSTNVAETSVTIDGVAAVIDGGLARVAAHAPWSGLPTLRVQKVSKASATQRAGRAGRTREGVCLRLYTRHDYEARPEFDPPEVRRLDLAETTLELHASGVREPRDFGWFEPPTDAALDAAESLLRDLGAVTAAGALTPTGRAMLRLPLHPRLARVVVESARQGSLDRGCTAAALLGERDISAARRGAGLAGGGWSPREAEAHGDSDVTALVARFEAAAAQGFDARSLRDEGLDPGAVAAVERVRRQLARVGRSVESEGTGSSPGDADEALRVALLAGYPDRVARRLRGLELVMVNGGSARLDPRSEVQRAEFLVAVDAEERTDPKARGAVVRSASAIEPEWLMELFPDAIREAVEGRWVAADERVDAVTRLYYRGLLLDEGRAPPSPEAERAVAEALAREALSKGVAHFAGDRDALDRWVARLAFVAEQFPEAKIAAPGDDALADALRRLCEGRRSFAELRDAGLLEGLRAGLDGTQRALVDRAAPERVTLPGGRAVKVHWERGKSPWIESRLQDFFGMAEGPRVASGRVPLVLHLLAPNQRAVQVTTDLAGFWSRHYAGIRKELCRKYPRHPWPEDGRAATPPAPRRG